MILANVHQILHDRLTLSVQVKHFPVRHIMQRFVLPTVEANAFANRNSAKLPMLISHNRSKTLLQLINSLLPDFIMCFKPWRYTLGNEKFVLVELSVDNKVGNIQFQDQSAVQALFDICRSQPVQWGVVNWGHDYGGLVGYDVDVENLFPGQEAKLRNEWPTDTAQTTDPMDISHLSHLVSRRADNHSANGHNTEFELEPRTPTSRDTFHRLPHEILLDIIVRLRSSDVTSFRLASRTIANIGMPDKFWHSRFWPGYEFEHIFELAHCQTARGQWKSVYYRARDLQSLPAMINRRRVWPLACQLSDLVARRLESRFYYGSLCKSFFNPDAKNENQTWHTAQSAIQPATVGFSEGSRSLCDASVVIEGPTSKAWASLVSLYGKNYISGLRFMQEDGDIVQLGSDHAAFIQDIKGGFDALKMVSLSVSSLESDMEKADRQSGGSFRVGESALWYPELPDSAFSLLGVEDTRLSLYLDHVPYSICLFGGKDGQLLPYLTKVTVWTIDRSYLGNYGDHTHIWAIEFHFDSPTDGIQTKMLGRIPEPDAIERHQYSILLDSRQGERISGIDTMYQDPRFVFALTIPPDITSNTREGTYFTETLRPTEGTIVGMFSVLKHNLVFQNLGVACI
ncbi:hypothetical protein FZEAL_8620 [Fusarium zealandicum]|uniref:F-box domain-containing protein n=1 Tax=Fusarium zealandicum TaxID=1053134 RepID=A0A8H4UE70_9HYPO|nr:hypothetical protein FZEAL_8620 [Fusarium zealandicum]